MIIKPENIKEGQIVFLVWAKRRIAKVKAFAYEEENDTLFIGAGGSGIYPASKFNFYTERVNAAHELKEYHRVEYNRYSSMANRLVFEGRKISKSKTKAGCIHAFRSKCLCDPPIRDDGRCPYYAYDRYECRGYKKPELKKKRQVKK